MAAGTVKAVVDDAEYELFRCGVIKPDRGRLFRLAVEAENDFSRRTGCLTAEASKTTVAGTYDYDIQTVVTAITQRIIKIWAVVYNTNPLRFASKAAFDRHPKFYDDYFEDVYTMVGATTIRLGFNPASLAGVLKFIYAYEAGTTILGDVSNFTVPGQYHPALSAYIIARYLMPALDVKNEKAQGNVYWGRYKLLVTEAAEAIASMYN
jgi:hypothetical protein